MMLALRLAFVAGAPTPRERAGPLGPAAISLFTNPEQAETMLGNRTAKKLPVNKKVPAKKHASQQDALAAAEINVALGRADAGESGKCNSVFWQQARAHVPSRRDFRLQVKKTGKNPGLAPGGGYMPDGTGPAW